MGLSCFLKQGCHAISLFFQNFRITNIESRCLLLAKRERVSAHFFRSPHKWLLKKAGVQRAASPLRGSTEDAMPLCRLRAAAIIGSTLDDKATAALEAAVTAAAKPISDRRGTVEFRKDVVAVLATRAARIAYARAKGAKE